MKRMFQIRLMILKKQYVSVLFWFMLPLIVLLGLSLLDTDIEQSVRIPVGIVAPEETPLIEEVVDSIEELPLVDLIFLARHEALNQLERHQLDSVFVFSADYDESIQKNERRGIVSHYTSNMSVAAVPVKESVLSLIQEQLNRSKAAQKIEQLFQMYSYSLPARDDIVSTSKEIEASERLIETSFTYTGKASAQEQPDAFISLWDIWIIAVFFSTMMLFEWVVREQNHATFKRISFTSHRPKSYLLINAGFYLLGCAIVDALSFAILSIGLSEPMTTSLMVAAVTFRITCVMGLFLFALLFKRRFSYITGAIFLFVILIGTSGIFIPVEGISRHMPLYAMIHPLQPVIHEQGTFLWLGICLLLCILWLTRKENLNVTRT